LAQSTDPDGRVITYAYDYLGRGTEENWFDNATDAADDADATNTVDYTYNVDDQTLTAADDFSSYSYTYFDTTGNLETADNNGINAAVGGGVPDVKLTYGYNAADQLSSETVTICPSGSATADFQNSYSYDSHHELDTIEQTGASGGNAVADKRVDFTYTTAGELSTVARYSDLTALTLVSGSSYGYDALGRLTSLADAEKTC
jgi:YD repeat-containing protein